MSLFHFNNIQSHYINTGVLVVWEQGWNPKKRGYIEWKRGNKAYLKPPAPNGLKPFDKKGLISAVLNMSLKGLKPPAPNGSYPGLHQFQHIKKLHAQPVNKVEMRMEWFKAQKPMQLSITWMTETLIMHVSNFAMSAFTEFQ